MKDPLYRAESYLMLRGVHIGDDMRRLRLISQCFHEQDLEYYKTRALIMASTGNANLISQSFKDYTEKVYPKDAEREKFVKDSRQILMEEESKTYKINKVFEDR